MSALETGQNSHPEVTAERWRELFMEADADRARLRSELEEARRDAERYRWLREQHTYDGEGDSDIARWYVQAGREPVPCDPGALDDQIDAAIAAQGAEHVQD